MKEGDAVHIIVQCAEAYCENLNNTNLLMVYRNKSSNEFEWIETVFLPRNFMHLTGVRQNGNNPITSVNFYNKCIDRRLYEDDFVFSNDGTISLKLSVLPNLMKKNLSAKMIGDYKEYSLVLHTEKIAGSTTACIGFVFDEESGLYVPNTVLKRDIREATKNNYARILAIYQKAIHDKLYNTCVYCGKGVDVSAIDPNDLLRSSKGS